MTSDAEIGARVRDLRVARGMRQVDLADAMRERGWKWVQSTVWNVEQGTRPVRLSEATSLAEALAVGIPAMTGDGDEDSFADGYRAGVAAVRTHLERFDA